MKNGTVIPQITPSRGAKGLGWWKSSSYVGQHHESWVVWLRCRCGMIGRLVTSPDTVQDSHTIAQDGTVSPSVICPDECGFHDHVRLDGWDGGFAP